MSAAPANFGKVGTATDAMLGLLSDQLKLIFLELQAKRSSGPDTFAEIQVLQKQIDAKRQTLNLDSK